MATHYDWQPFSGAIATLALLLSSSVTWAQSIQTDGTTVVNQTGDDYAITGGTVSGDNQNLFHSFTDFNLLNGETATFFADPAVLNILGRVTGGNASLIDGLLSVCGHQCQPIPAQPRWDSVRPERSPEPARELYRHDSQRGELWGRGF
jgi:hypothetical protein